MLVRDQEIIEIADFKMPVLSTPKFDGSTQLCASGGRATFEHIVKLEINSKPEAVESLLSVLQKV